MKRIWIRPKRFGALVGILAWLALSLAPGQNTLVAAQGIGGTKTVDMPKIVPSEFNGDVRTLPQIPSKPKVEVELQEPRSIKPAISPSGPTESGPLTASVAAPAASHNFAGLSYNSSCTGGLCGAGIPPDTNGEVGPAHYIQAVNSSFAIYSKAGGLLAAFTEDSLWSGAGASAGPCKGNNQGDPVVIFDPLANRWILTDFAFALDLSGNPIAPFYECFAVSKTGDPVNGGWWLYALHTDTNVAGQPPKNTLNDYPKFGIWNDCLYYSANGFDMGSGGVFNGGEFASISRADMYSGAALTVALGFLPYSNLNPDYFTMIPANLSAPTSIGLPPSGRHEFYVQESLVSWAYEVRTFTPGPNCSSGTLSPATNVSQTSYEYPGTSSTNDIVPQPNTSIKLDSLGDRLMQKVQYRRVGAAESLWVTHTVRTSSTGPTAVQWAQINVSGGVIRTTPAQQQIFNPSDGRYRWMASIAADRDGNAAIAYSLSGTVSPNFPSIAYAGRLATDPVNRMPQTERLLVSGAGSQVNNCGGLPCHRWGDYSSISIDPVDGCTFWFTNEYYASQTAGNSGAWNTRIGSFKFPSCGTRNFRSVGTYDGWVLESGETTSLGGSLDSTATTFNLGDDASNKQYRAVLSFNTAGLPDNAVIKSVVLKFKLAGQVGSNPFSTLGNITVDMRKGSFNSNIALENADFQATASRNGVMSIPNTPSSGWYSRSLSSSYFSLVNLTGPTQFRLRFATDDNNNHVADYLMFYSGNYATTSYRPLLIVTFNVP